MTNLPTVPTTQTSHCFEHGTTKKDPTLLDLQAQPGPVILSAADSAKLKKEDAESLKLRAAELNQE
ncbi:hypothetical protein NEOLI_004051 [Neolecta irregularis DAH-3]|uniref:Uncharacterized protein n=1 Tax=Neolecta irregularis (strain DAH-3) TaxID=1198029 RepID=A0A1U7LLW3_NEOID|nr:hypothetical protein NEOLI_004051 [Neolecta irregularis DAH-3]|eukprot:OLL23573.1 hypothetical protein NEOLI_004051 [Neolecta irregularis DAH-3]